MSRRCGWTVAACLTFGIGYGVASAQQSPATFWYMSQFQVDWRLADSLQYLLRSYQLPIAQEAQRQGGDLLDEKWLFHHTGTEYNVIRLRRFRTWDAIENDTTFAAAYRRMYPNAGHRAAIDSAFGRIFQGAAHRDAIYVEVTR